MRGCVGAEFLRSLRQGDIHARLATPRAFQQELESEGGLPGARMAFDEVNAMGRQASPQKMVESADTGGHALIRNDLRLPPVFLPWLSHFPLCCLAHRASNAHTYSR